MASQSSSAEKYTSLYSQYAIEGIRLRIPLKVVKSRAYVVMASKYASFRLPKQALVSTPGFDLGAKGFYLQYLFPLSFYEGPLG